MGSLFSSTKPDTQPTRRQTVYENKPVKTFVEYAPSQTYYSPRTYQRDLSENMYYRHQVTIQKTNAGLKLCEYLLTANSWEKLEGHTTVYLKLLDFNSSKYAEINSIFKKTTQRHFEVNRIIEVQNPYMYGFYLLKKEEMRRKFRGVEEKLLFHGTKTANITNIIENNLNWRLHGQSRGNIFGKGVSFTPISCYASNYSDKFQNVKVMILAKVLVSNETIGNANMQIPPLLPYSRYRYDTSIKPNGHVVVKYSDNDFYPQHIIYYTGQQIKTVKY